MIESTDSLHEKCLEIYDVTIGNDVVGKREKKLINTFLQHLVAVQLCQNVTDFFSVLIN